MIRSELVSRLDEAHRELSHAEAEQAVAIILDSIAERLAEGGRVELRGFGSFSVREHGPRQGRNPRTGEVVAVAQKRSPHFRPGKTLLGQLVYGGREKA